MPFYLGDGGMFLLVNHRARPVPDLLRVSLAWC